MQELTDIANAIREKRGTSVSLTLAQMPDEIRAIVSNVRIVRIVSEQTPDLPEPENMAVSVAHAAAYSIIANSIAPVIPDANVVIVQ